MGDDIKQKREAVKNKILGEFNKVAAKVMKVDDLAKNFEKEDGKYFGFFQKYKTLIAEHMMNNMLKKDIPAEEGVFTSTENGKNVTYVSSDFLRRHMIKAIDEGKADGHLDDVQKVGLAAVDAVRDSPDQSPRVKAGQIKPKR